MVNNVPDKNDPMFERLEKHWTVEEVPILEAYNVIDLEKNGVCSIMWNLREGNAICPHRTKLEASLIAMRISYDHSKILKRDKATADLIKRMKKALIGQVGAHSLIKEADAWLKENGDE